jgi:hypothetical protein
VKNLIIWSASATTRAVLSSPIGVVLLMLNKWLVLAAASVFAFVAWQAIALAGQPPYVPPDGILNSPWWGVASAIAAVIAIPTAIILWQRQRAIKILTYDPGMALPLFFVSPSVRDKITISYDGAPVERASLRTITLFNHGTSPIAKSDFDVPVTIYLTGDGALVSVEPEINGNVRVAYDLVDQSTVRLNPFLINKGERISISFLILNGDPEFRLECRIIGGNFISKESLGKIPKTIMKIAVGIFRFSLVAALVFTLGGMVFWLGRVVSTIMH